MTNHFSYVDERTNERANERWKRPWKDKNRFNAKRRGKVSTLTQYGKGGREREREGWCREKIRNGRAIRRRAKASPTKRCTELDPTVMQWHKRKSLTNNKGIVMFIVQILNALWRLDVRYSRRFFKSVHDPLRKINPKIRSARQKVFVQVINILSHPFVDLPFHAHTSNRAQYMRYTFFFSFVWILNKTSWLC